MSTFDAAAFEAMTIDEANETKMTPVPEGDEYIAYIDGWKIRSVDIGKGARAGQTVPILAVTWVIEDPDGELKEKLNLDQVRVQQDIWLDITDNGSLAFGPNQNVGLGRLREAVGLNKKGKVFSFANLEGQGPCKLTIKVFEDANGFERNNVTRVIKA